MSSAYVRSCALVALLAVSIAACAGSHDESAGAGEPGAPGGLGTTQQAYCVNHSIVNVVIAPGTYHWEDPAHLLNSAEGFGPRSLSVSIAASISPSSSSSSTYSPSNSEISTSVGYDVTATSSLDASTTVLVPFGGYARVDAFATFQKTTWDVVGTNCFGGSDNGVGVSYKPVGVYFKTCLAYDCSLGGAVGGGPIPSGPGPSGGGAGGGGGAGSSATGSASTGGGTGGV